MAESQDNTPKAVVGGAKKPRQPLKLPQWAKNLKKPALIILAVLLIGGLIAGYFATRPTDVCRGELLNRSAAAVEPNKSEELASVAGEIQKLDKYDTDSTCLYVVTSYNVSIGDIDNAGKNLDKLNSLIDKNEPVKESVASLVGLDTLRAKVAFLKEQKKKLYENVVPSERYKPQ